MAKNDIGGVWRTVGGRRIFIKDGQDLSSAMKESGKFGSKTKTSSNQKNYKEMSDRELKDELYDNDRMLNEMERRLSGRYELSDEKRDELERRAMHYESTKDEIRDELRSRKEQENKKDNSNDKKYKTRDVKDYQDEKGRWHINDTAKNEIDKEVSMMSGKDLKEAYNSLEKNDNSYEARAIRGEYNQRQVNEEKFHQTTQNMIKSSGSSDDSFTMTNGSREVTVSKDDSGKWVDSDGNKYMGYLSKSDVKSYFKGDWREAKTSESSKTEAKNYMQDQFKAFDKGNISGADLEREREKDYQKYNKWLKDQGVDKQLTEEEYNKMSQETEKINNKGLERGIEMEKDNLARRKQNGDSVENISNKTRNIHELELEKQKSDQRLARLNNTNETSGNNYNNYYEKEKLGTPSNYKTGDKVLVQDSYSGKYDTEYTVVREATKEEKSGKVNTNLKAYVLKDKDGNEIIKADTRIKTSESSKTNESNVRKLFDKDKEYKFNNNVKNETEWKEKNKAILEKGYKEETGTDPYKNGKAKTSFEDYQTWRYGKEADKENNGSNDWVRNAFNDYKKEHPNTKMTLEQFKKSKK